jgi:hypothetical protein
VWEELYQNDISPNHEGKGCGESYSRMIFLQIMRDKSVVLQRFGEITHWNSSHHTPLPHDLEKYHPGIALATPLSLMIWRNIILV